MSEPLAAPSITEIGKARARIDGPLKVTGTARYASDHSFPGMLYAVPVGATIAKGKIKTIDTSRARQMPGVRAVLKRGDLIPISRITPSFGDASCWTSRDRRLTTTLFVITANMLRLRSRIRSKRPRQPRTPSPCLMRPRRRMSIRTWSPKETKVVSERGNAEKAYAGRADHDRCPLCDIARKRIIRSRRTRRSRPGTATSSRSTKPRKAS